MDKAETLLSREDVERLISSVAARNPEMLNASKHNILEQLAIRSGRSITIDTDINGNFCVAFANSVVFDGVAEIGICGRGRTIEEATKDYITRISGKKLRFGGSKDNISFIILDNL